MVIRHTDLQTFAPNEFVINTNISTQHKGKGFFIYTPDVNDTNVYLEIPKQ